jgi:hypothetical protein
MIMMAYAANEQHQIWLGWPRSNGQKLGPRRENAEWALFLEACCRRSATVCYTGG